MSKKRQQKPFFERYPKIERLLNEPTVAGWVVIVAGVLLVVKLARWVFS